MYIFVIITCDVCLDEVNFRSFGHMENPASRKPLLDIVAGNGHCCCKVEHL